MQDRAVASERGGIAAEPFFRRLRPGPGQSAPDVASHQRQRIQRAMIELVAESGYQSVTVRSLARLAGVSTGTFYSQFDGKEDCFVATCATEMEATRERVAGARAPLLDREIQLARTIRSLLDGSAACPEDARLALVDAFSGGPAALGRIREFETALQADVRSTLDRRGSRASSTATSWISAGCLRVARNSAIEKRRMNLAEAVRILASWGNECLGGKGSESVSRSESEGPAPVNSESEVLDCSAGADDRDLLLSAVIKLARDDGYWCLSVARVCRSAGISRPKFKRHFRDVADCYLVAMRTLAACYFAGSTRTSPPLADPVDWRAWVASDLSDLCRRIAADPQLAKLIFLEIVEPGVEGLQCRETVIGELAEAWRSTAPPSTRPPRLVAEASMASLWEVIRQELERDSERQWRSNADTWTPYLLASSSRNLQRSLAPSADRKPPLVAAAPS